MCINFDLFFATNSFLGRQYKHILSDSRIGIFHMATTIDMSLSSPLAAIVPGSFGTHDGTFHADEVTACALLLFFDLIKQDKIVRTRDLNTLRFCDFVCDVGGEYKPEQRRFDHHQLTYKGPYSSAGMILEYLKHEKKLTEKEYDYFNNMLIRGIDAHDNGKEVQTLGVCTFSHVVANFTPISHEATSEEQDEAFFLALDFTLGHIRRLHHRFIYNQSCSEEVRTAMQKYQDCLIFDRNIPWMDAFFELDGRHHPAKFVIMPTGRFWKLRAIPPTGEERMKVRQPLPESWAGLLEHDLQQKTGLEGALFCHKGRFISVWKTKENAIQALNHILV